MSREIKLGILTVATLALVFITLNFIKGSNVFSKSITLFTKFDNVAGLDISSPVYMNGLKVGAVKNITMNPANIAEMIVEFRIEGDLKLPKDTKVVFRSDGVVSGNALDLSFTKLCSGSDCVMTGAYLENTKLGLINSMLSETEIDEVSSKLETTAKDVIGAVGREDSDAPVDVSARELESTLSNMTKLTAATNKLIRSSSKNIEATMANLNVITSNLAQQNDKISTMLSNMNKLTEELSRVKLTGVTDNANKAMVSAEKSMKDVSATLVEAENTFKELNKTIKKMNEGDGSLAQLMNDKKLYNNLEETSKNMSLLLQDLRLNPKRYVNVSVFGKKSKAYIKPDDDPAFNDKN